MNCGEARPLGPSMQLEAWDETTTVRFDRALWTKLCSLRFVLDSYNVLTCELRASSPSHATTCRKIK